MATAYISPIQTTDEDLKNLEKYMKELENFYKLTLRDITPQLLQMNRTKGLSVQEKQKSVIPALVKSINRIRLMVRTQKKELNDVRLTPKEFAELRKIVLENTSITSTFIKTFHTHLEKMNALRIRIEDIIEDAGMNGFIKVQSDDLHKKITQLEKLRGHSQRIMAIFEK